LSFKNPNARVDDNLILDDEDEIIADPYFASILNENREIQVNDIVYHYTVDGVYFTHEETIGLMYDYLDKVDNNETSQELAYEQEVTRGVFLIKPTLIDDAIDEELCPVGDPCDDGSYSYSGGSGSNSLEAPSPDSFHLCDESVNNFWTDLFGDKVVCVDHYARDKRIKTKAWNQNYFLYSSVGISVRSQKRKLRIWWRQKIDELRLGTTMVAFDYPKVKMKWPQHNQAKIFFEYQGARYDQYGNYVSNIWQHPTSIFDNWPITGSYNFYYTYFFDDKESFGHQGIVYSYKHNKPKVNSILQDLTKQGIKLLNRAGNSLEEDNPIAVAVAIPDPTDPTLSFPGFMYDNLVVVKQNEGKIAHIFDWNTAEIKFTYNAGSFDFPKPQFNARKYKNAIIEGFGMGRRGSSWKGSRVSFSD